MKLKNNEEFYLTTGLRIFAVNNRKIDDAKLNGDLDRWHNPLLKIGESSKDGANHNFGRGLWLHIGFLRAVNWKKAIDAIARRKLYVFDSWGIAPGLKEGIKGGSGWTISREVECYLQKRLGKYFLGWDNGENDGRWFWQAMRIYPAPSTRKEAYEQFVGWFKPLLLDLRFHVNALCGLTFPHYFARMKGHRMIGAEFLQALPSVPMWAAWVRGASRQYRIPWMAGISIFNLFGYKTFEEDSIKNWRNQKDYFIGNPHCETGPDRGPSLSLIKRTWYLLFMYGVNIEALEASQFFQEKHLNALGKFQLAATRFCVKNKKRRGKQYCPVAALIDLHAGWAPPRHFYTDSFYTVWGCLPYEKGDHQIDLFFREIYPGYQDCPYFRDERGFLTATPYGDIVDVLLSDATDEILAGYRCVVALGEFVVQGELFKRLRRYAENGGTIIWSLSQLADEAKTWCGIATNGKMLSSQKSFHAIKRRIYHERPYEFSQVVSVNGSALLKSGRGVPLVVTQAIGKGQIITVTVPFGLTKKGNEPHPLMDADPSRDTNSICYYDKPLGSPYQLLTGVKDILFDYFNSLSLIHVQASIDPVLDWTAVKRPVNIQYLTNVTDGRDKLIVTLANSNLFPVYVFVKLKHGKIRSACDLLHCEKSPSLMGGGISLVLHPSDGADFNLRIIELESDNPIMPAENPK